MKSPGELDVADEQRLLYLADLLLPFVNHVDVQHSRQDCTAHCNCQTDRNRRQRSSFDNERESFTVASRSCGPSVQVRKQLFAAQTTRKQLAALVDLR